METILLAVAAALVGGMAVGLQAPLASLIGQRLGSLESIFIVHLSGALASGLLLAAVKQGGNLGAWRSLPWYALMAGTLGLLVIGDIAHLSITVWQPLCRWDFSFCFLHK